MSRSALIVLTMAFLAGCAGTKVRRYSDFDPSDKSITLAVGSESPLGEIKDGFAKRGYRVVVHHEGTRTTEQSLTTRLSEPEHRTRYRLFLRVLGHQELFACTDEINFELSVIDQGNGSEVLTMTGLECGGEKVASKLFEALKI